jgi:signal transduction histidine kinase
MITFVRAAGHQCYQSVMQTQALATAEDSPTIASAQRRFGRDHEVRAIATTFLQLRPFIVGPYLILQWFIIAASGASGEQLTILGVSNALFLAVFIHEAWRARLGLVTAVWIFRSCAATLIAIAFGTLGTGAMASPMLPMMFAPVGVTFAVFGRTRQSAILLGILIAIGFVLAVVTPYTRALVVASPNREYAMAAAILACSLLLYVGVASLTAAHRRAADALAAQGDDALRATSIRVREWESQGAQIAHELKNPLAAIQSLVEVMSESAEERNIKRLQVVSGELVRLNGIVEGYRSLATTAPFQSIKRTAVNVDALLEGVVMMLDARVARSGVSLTFDSPEISAAELARTVQLTAASLDRDRVKEALINLVQNALQACSSGGSIRLSRTLQDDQTLVIRVADTGSGMTSAVLDKIGTPYFSQRKGGTGLGVALARKVAEQHGGALKYESSVGHGTTAILELPLLRESN